MARYLAFAALLAVVGLVIFPGGSDLDGAELPTTRLEGIELVKTISQGQRVEVENYLVPGQWTLLEFTAHW